MYVYMYRQRTGGGYPQACTCIYKVSPHTLTSVKKVKSKEKSLPHRGLNPGVVPWCMVLFILKKNKRKEKKRKRENEKK